MRRRKVFSGQLIWRSMLRSIRTDEQFCYRNSGIIIFCLCLIVRWDFFCNNFFLYGSNFDRINCAYTVSTSASLDTITFYNNTSHQVQMAYSLNEALSDLDVCVTGWQSFTANTEIGVSRVTSNVRNNITENFFKLKIVSIQVGRKLHSLSF